MASGRKINRDVSGLRLRHVSLEHVIDFSRKRHGFQLSFLYRRHLNAAVCEQLIPPPHGLIEDDARAAKLLHPGLHGEKILELRRPLVFD